MKRIDTTCLWILREDHATLMEMRIHRREPLYEVVHRLLEPQRASAPEGAEAANTLREDIRQKNKRRDEERFPKMREQAVKKFEFPQEV